jgi:U32 family peptidase
VTAPARLPELLAPGGDPDAVRAAILAGADAVYLGLARFNARMRATNIDGPSLRALCRLARSHGVRVYVTLNTLVTDAEMGDATELGLEALRFGADALILQDLGLVRWFREHAPDAELHASTQLTTHDQVQLEVLARAGAAQVNLARELRLEEIAALTTRAHELGLRAEVFVHGAYCVSFSGQCSLSALMTGLSGNRGECVQPCRRAFALGGESTPRYPLNLKDMNALDAAAELLAAGVDAFKIEGRRKGFYYVHTVVAAWRTRLDALARGEDVRGENPSLDRVFNRGFSLAYLRGTVDRDAFAAEVQDRSLKPLGTVSSYSADSRTLAFVDALPLRPGLRAGVYGRDQEYVGQFVVEAVLAPDRYRIRIEHALRGKIHRGQRVLALAEQVEADAVLAAARALEVRRTPLSIAASGALGSPLEVRFSDGRSAVTASSRVALQRASRSELDGAQLGAHLGKLGETDFALAGLDTSRLEPGLFLPVSELNRLRQAAVEQLERDRAPQDARRTGPSPIESPRPRPLAPPFRQRLLFVTDRLELARALRAGSEPACREDELLALELQGQGDRPAADPGEGPLEDWLAPLFPAIVFDAELPGYLATLASRPWRLVLSENLGLGGRAADAGIPWIAGELLSTSNAGSLEALAALAGAGGAVLSSELNLSQIGELAAASAGSGLLRLATVFGPLLGLQTRQCLVYDFKACRLERTLPSCLAGCRVVGALTMTGDRRPRRGGTGLEGATHFAVKRPGFHSQVWDSRLLSRPEAVGALAASVDAFVVDLRDPGFLGRTPEETLSIASCFRDLVDGGRRAGKVPARLRALLGSRRWRGPPGR